MSPTGRYRLVNEGRSVYEPIPLRETPSASNGKRPRKEYSLGRGILTGLVGGFLGTVVMTQFQNAWIKTEKSAKTNGQHGAGAPQEQQREQSGQQQEDPTMAVAGRIAHFTGRELSHEQKEKLGPVVHYAFGTLQGGLYGASLAAMGKPGNTLTGVLFGAALFGAADEVAVPAFHLSSSPDKTPLSAHLYGLASHLVYGVSAELSRRLAQKML